eukprot:evm.model.scf_170.5 EVM.evm.TU.scf_170.5   scf_170:99888-110092(-)
MGLRRGMVLGALLAALAGIGLSGARDEFLIGWQGETYRPADVWRGEQAKTLGGRQIEQAPASEPWIETLSWRPRAFLYHSFMTDEECEHFIQLGAPQMKRSLVVSSSGDNGEVSDYRSSYGTFLNRMQDPILTRVERRLSEWTHLPMINQEDVQILRYGHGQNYKPHMDVLVVDDDDGRRQATVLVYLSDVEAGGETAFPNTRRHHWVDPGNVERMGKVSDCAAGHVAAKPKKGDALLFYSLKPNGAEDFMSEHTGCPVENGTKWTATIWIHETAFRADAFYPPPPDWAPQDPGACVDFDERCPALKDEGLCEADAINLVGSVRHEPKGPQYAVVSSMFIAGV